MRGKLKKSMKKTIKIKDLCCQRCADHLAKKLLLIDGVRAAKGNYAKNLIFVDVADSVTDEMLKEMLAASDMEVLSIEKRKGIFG